MSGWDAYRNIDYVTHIQRKKNNLLLAHYVNKKSIMMVLLQYLWVLK